MEDRLKLIHNLNTAINKVRNFSTPNFNNVFSRQYSEDIIFNMLNSKNTNYENKKNSIYFMWTITGQL